MRLLVLKNFAKICVAFALAFVLVMPILPVPFETTAFARQPDETAADALGAQIGTRRAPRLPGTRARVTGVIPCARLVTDAALRTELTARFAAQHAAFSQAHQAHALNIDHSVQFFTSSSGDNTFLSVVLTMEATWATTAAASATTVINVDTLEIVSLDDYNSNARVLINNHIRAKIAANPRGFVSSFGGVPADHPFYLDGDRLVVPFGSAELIPTERAVHSIELSIENFRGLLIDERFFFQLPHEQYSAIMVRIRPVLLHFEYGHQWDDETATLEILVGDRVVSSLTIYENAYFYRRIPVRALEAAPIIRHGHMYVPLSFFDELMGIGTAVNLDAGQIFMTRYMATEMPALNLDHLQ